MQNPVIFDIICLMCPFSLITLFAAALLTNCADVAAAAFEKRSGTPFEIVGSVLRDDKNGAPHLNIADDTGGATIVDIENDPKWNSVRDGDILRIHGIVQLSTNGLTSARCRRLTILGHEDPAPPVAMDFSAFNSGRLDCRRINACGKLMEVFTDEIDPRYVYASLNCQGNIVYLTFRSDSISKEDLLRLRDAVITVTGTVLKYITVARRSLGRIISCQSLANIEINAPPPSDVFDVPPIPIEISNAATEILSMGRRRTEGTVIAVRSNRRIYLREKANATRCVTLATDKIPCYGDKIEVAGLPETDFYRINLTDADWRHLESSSFSIGQAKQTSIANLLTDEQGHPCIKHSYHGQLIRIEGLVIDQPRIESFQNILTLKDGDLTISIELTSAKDVLKETSVGCRISVTGICIVDTETWRPTAGFPHATGIVIVPRDADDIQVLSRPPWWTPRRFLILVLILFILLIAILGWNRFLQTMIKRKSHQLLREQLAKERVALRVSERTNLAVELHDALSQNLTGLAFQLATAKSALAADPTSLPRHLDTAERMLVSSRTELKRCLTDLRDNTLDEKDFDAAIRRTLLPVAGEAKTNISFNVSRQKLNDTTAHSILCIIRELAANAVLHGQATKLDIHGETDGHQLMFSVSDNGAGFDPSSRPGLAEGHFGLDGIRERIEHLNGTILIDSAPGRGTCVTISEIIL